MATTHSPRKKKTSPQRAKSGEDALRLKLREKDAELRAALGEAGRLAARLEAAAAPLSRRQQRLEKKVLLREAQLSEKVKRLSILYEVGRAVSAVLELDLLLALIVRLAARHLKARKASLMLVEPGTGAMKINAAVGIRRWIVERTRIKVGEGIAGMVAASGEAILIEDIARDKRFHRPSRGTYRTGSFLSVPLRRQEGVLGVLNVADKRSQTSFDTDDFNLVTTLAAEAAIAVENATLYGRLREHLTSLEELYRQRESERRRLQTLINSITDGILAVDLKGRLLFMNEKARSLLGWRGGLAASRAARWRLRRSRLGRAIVENLDYALSIGGNQRGLTIGRDWSGRRHFELISLPVKEGSGDAAGALTVIRDVTESKELDEARSDFLNRASHQLRTPVGLIKGFVDTLIRHPDMDDARRRHFMGLVHAESDRLAGLVDNLLDFTRLESRILPLEKERVDAAALLVGAVEAIRARAQESGITFDLHLAPDLPVVETDPKFLTEVLRNLIDNSLKFTPRGGRVRLSARAVSGRIEVSVADTGRGIDEADLPHIFEKFFVGRDSGASGTGLGLFIAKEMIDGLGGTIEVASRKGRGTKVKFGLPLAAAGREA